MTPMLCRPTGEGSTSCPSKHAGAVKADQVVQTEAKDQESKVVTSRPVSCSTKRSMLGSVGAAWSRKPKLSFCKHGCAQHGLLQTLSISRHLYKS